MWCTIPLLPTPSPLLPSITTLPFPSQKDSPFLPYSHNKAETLAFCSSLSPLSFPPSAPFPFPTEQVNTCCFTFLSLSPPPSSFACLQNHCLSSVFLLSFYHLFYCLVFWLSTFLLSSLRSFFRQQSSTFLYGPLSPSPSLPPLLSLMNQENYLL